MNEEATDSDKSQSDFPTSVPDFEGSNNYSFHQAFCDANTQ